MLDWVIKMVMGCLRSAERRTNLRTADPHDALLWCRDLFPHSRGELSYAVIQANAILEDHSQVETAACGTLVGVYDGHGGPEAALFVNEHLFANVKKFASEYGGMSDYVLRKAFRETEDGFLSLVREESQTKPQLATVGSCCLVGAISDSTLYVASLGDSRAVLGSFMRNNANTRRIQATQISTEHNVNVQAVRQELMANHPEDSHIVMLKRGVWRVKGLIQVSRAIGDAYLKGSVLNRESQSQRFRLPGPLHKPALSAEPTIITRVLEPQDQFVIFASDGLWEHLGNQEAVEIVQKHPRRGIAKRLIKAALQAAAKKREILYLDLTKIEPGTRRHFHDDITVVVLFLDDHLVGKGSNVPSMSLKAGEDSP